MSKAKELRDKFEADLKQLQDNCPHEKTQRMPYMWAPGHSSGDCLICLECNKILKHYDLQPLNVSFSSDGGAFEVTLTDNNTRKPEKND